MVVFALPYGGRAILFHFGIYSERTLNGEVIRAATCADASLCGRSMIWWARRRWSSTGGSRPRRG